MRLVLGRGVERPDVQVPRVFAGGGMARAGLGEAWLCIFADDNDAKKRATYAANWGNDHLAGPDVADLTTADLPGHTDLAWASFPCQDLSLAGDYAGLKGKRFGTFWPFWGLMKSLAEEGRAPSVTALENVCGALTSHEGKDFAAISAALADSGYRFGAVVIDAIHFLPQSRPRLLSLAHTNRWRFQSISRTRTPIRFGIPQLLSPRTRICQRNQKPPQVCREAFYSAGRRRSR